MNKDKRRDAVKAEVEALRGQLAAKSAVLEDIEHDAEHLQQTANKLMAEVAGASASPKLAGEAPRGFKAIKRCVDSDDACLATPEYNRRRAEAEAAGTQPLYSTLCASWEHWATSRWNRRPSALARQALEGGCMEEDDIL